MMAGTVNLFGHAVKTPYVVIGALIILAGGVWEYRRIKGSQSSPAPAGTAAAAAIPAAAAGGDPYPPDGTAGDPSDPYSTDPSTGATYGDEQLEGGYAGFAGDTGLLGDLSGFGGFGGLGPLGASAPGPAAFTSNGQWAQAAEQYLTEQTGANAETVSAALGKYITGQGVTADQQTIIEQAIAYEDYPPVAGSSGFPPSIHLLSASGGGGTGATIPKVTGLTFARASAVLTSAGFKAAKVSPSGWHDPVTRQDPAGGAHAKAGTTVHLTGTARTQPSPNPARRKVPRVTGLPYTQAAQILRADGFRVRPARPFAGTVSRQVPAAGDRAAAGATVTLSEGR